MRTSGHPSAPASTDVAAKRLLAIVGALLLVVGAIIVRNWIDGGGELSLTGTPSPVICDRLIADPCRSVFPDARIEDPGTTFDTLASSRNPAEVVWIADPMWFEMLDDQRGAASQPSVFGGAPSVLASTDLAFVTKGDSPCASWVCLTTTDLAPGLGIDSTDTTTGLRSLAQLASAVLGRPDFASNDAGFRTWRSTLVTTPQAGSNLLGAIANQVGRYRLVTAALADVQVLERPDLVATLPDDAGPPLQVGAVAVGGANIPKLDELVTALEAADWRRGAGPDVAGPRPGVLRALRSQ